MANHKFKCFDTERFDVVVGVVRRLGLPFYVAVDPLTVVITENMSDDDYSAVWDALSEYNTRPDALPMP